MKNLNEKGDPHLFDSIAKDLLSSFTIVDRDDSRPWGGFFVIDDKQAGGFINTFFPGLEAGEFDGRKLSPKILVVMPGKRLSWQYHFRRSEIWRVLQGEVGIITSGTDSESPVKKYGPGSLIRIGTGERHRLIGLDAPGIIAEIWQHTDKDNPSDESDIVRVQDDHGR